MKQDAQTVESLFYEEMNKYVNLVEELSDLEDLGIYGGNKEEVAKLLKKSMEKLELIRKIAKNKLDIDLPKVAIYCKIVGRA